jgi:hypothetical protein
VADCKSQLKRLARTLKKLREERADAERSGYPMGVRAADEDIKRWMDAEHHFTMWLAEHDK